MSDKVNNSNRQHNIRREVWNRVTWRSILNKLNMHTILSPTANSKESLQDIAFDLPGRFPIARWAAIPLRLIVGFGFMEHGFAKLSKGPAHWPLSCTR